MIGLSSLSPFFIGRCRVSKKEKMRSCPKIFKSERKGSGSSSSATNSGSGAPLCGGGDISSPYIKRIPVCSWWFCLVSTFFLLITFSAASETPVHVLKNTTTTTLVPTTTPPPPPSVTAAAAPLPSTTSTHIKASIPSISPSTLITRAPPTRSTHHRLILVLSVSAAAAAAALLIIIIMGFLLCFPKFNTVRSKRRSSKRVEDADLPQYSSSSSSSSSSSDLDLDTNEQQKKIGGPHHSSSIRKFSWEEIVKVSKNFSVVIGQGGLSTVYLASFLSDEDSSLLLRGALKIHQKSERLNGIFKEELRILLHLNHPNIVQIFGYCDEPQQGDEMGGALVFEYVPNGNLQEKLHGDGDGNGNRLLMWKNRMWIAFQLATAIEYLHDKCTLPIVHGDIKSSNVLLDDQLNCKLCDFGSAKMGFSATVVPSGRLRHSLVGSPGYVDPHYLRTGIASKKNDVYSFGVIILELITGMEAFCSEKQQLLTTIAGPLLRRGEGDTDDHDVDPRPLTAAWAMPQDLNHFDSEEVMVMASICAQCLQQQPSLRPSMADILTTMKSKLSSIPCCR